MIVINLPQFPFRGVAAPYLWMFYKFLFSTKGDKHFLVHRDYLLPPEEWKEQGRWELSEGTQHNLGYRVPTNETLASASCSLMSDDIFERMLLASSSNPVKAFEKVLSEIIPDLMDYYSGRIDDLLQDGEVEAIFSPVNCPSLQEVAKSRSIPLVHFELGPLRSPGYVDLAYFDFQGLNEKSEFFHRYEGVEQKNNKKYLIDLENIRKQYIKGRWLYELASGKEPSHDVGVVLQIEDDTNLIASSNGFNNQSLIAYSKIKFNQFKVAYKSHPGSFFQIKIGEGSKSYQSAAEFLFDCKAVLTINSSMGLEGLLWGKKAYLVGRAAYELIATIEDEQERHHALNFFLSNYLVPFELVFEMEYIRFRLSGPKEEEIQMRHRMEIDKVIAREEMKRLEQEVAKCNEKIMSLNEAVTERELQITSLSQRMNEHEGQIIASLGQAVSERDEQIASLNQAVSERDEQIASFHQVEMERTNHIASLNQAVTARDEQTISVNQTIEQLKSQLKQERACSEAYKNSLSWRVTAPMRWVAAPLVFFYRLAIDPNVYWRLLAVIFLIPVAVVYYHGFWGMVKNLPRRWLAFDEILRNEDEVNDRMDGSSELSRKIVFTCFSIAIRLKRTSSIRRSVVNLLNIFKHEGGGAFMGHLRNTSPDQLSAIPEVNAGSDVVHVLDVAVGKRILVSDYRIPRPDVSAGERATMGILQDLCSLGYEVFFLPNDMASSPRYEAALRSAGVHIITQASGFEYSAHYLEKYGDQFGVFYFIRVDVAENLLPIARRVAPDARVIFHAPDLYFLRELRGAELQNDPVARERALHTRDRELAMMGRSDRVVVVSPAEVPVLRTVLPDTPISVFPVLYAPVVANPRPYARRKHIFFLGGFAHPPNVSAVQWFASAVWPHVREALPDVEFHILGAEAPDTVVALGKQSGIKVVGFVPELEPVLETLRVGVAPLQYGAGIKGKVAVTMGAGIPCVCTGVAAEGMGIKNDVHALIEDDPVRFAQAVVRLYNDEKTWSRLAKYGQALVDENYGNAANRASLLRVLDQALALPVSLFINYCQAAAPVSVPNPSLEAQVDISIIIPVFNKWNLTRACLTSVVQTSVGNGVVYEILLADDGSTDETTGASEFFPGLRVVKTPKNMGFLRNCNNAAQHARGRYLLLLNNDTVVLPGWLDSLYRTIEEDSSIAIAGSKLLYPDEHIQEAGGGLLSDADGVSVGRWRWVGEQNFPVRRHDPLFNIRRETDYISGASILVRKSFWDSVGGFDERYKNAYCEDSDLAMMARSKGLRVVYEPGSEVIHFEHQTYSGQISADHARLQRENKARLIAKWRDVLEHDHLPAGSKWYQVAAHGERCVPVAAQTRRKRGNLNILYFSPFPSHPSNHGNQATIQQFAQQFQKMGHKVHFALLQSGMYSREHEQMMRDAWDTFDILPNSHPLGSNGHPIPFDGWYEEGLGERIRLLCARYDIDIVFCSYIFQSKMLEYVPNYILKVIDTHDKMGDRYEMLRKNGQPLEFFSCTPEEEGAYLRRADVVVARRAEEARYFDSVTGQKTAIVIPHVEAPQFLDRNFDSLKHVGVVASANRINLAIVRELLEAIDRKLGDGACPFIVHVAGQVKDMVQTLPANERAVFARSWVRMHGFVPDIAKFYGDVNLVISPVTMGTGINVKTVQAMAYGMPLLTTECGSKGVETPELLHHHESLDALVASLLSLKERPNEIARLAEVSRSCYMEFHEKANAAFAGLWCHPRLGCSVV